MKDWLAIPLMFALAAACIFGAAILFLFDPTTHGFYPVCLIHQTTGYSCPGCGTLRALHQLTHGNFAAAWGFNPFVFVLLPAGGWLALRQIVRVLFGRQWPGIITRPVCGWVLLAAMLIFGVWRNLHV